MLRAALLFCLNLRTNLEDMEVKINPYNPYVANKDVNGSQ